MDATFWHSDAFTNNTIGNFVRVLIVNPLHKKLLKLVLVVCCMCNSFDVNWVWQQWDVIYMFYGDLDAKPLWDLLFGMLAMDVN